MPNLRWFKEAWSSKRAAYPPFKNQAPLRCLNMDIQKLRYYFSKSLSIHWLSVCIQCLHSLALSPPNHIKRCKSSLLQRLKKWFLGLVCEYSPLSQKMGRWAMVLSNRLSWETWNLSCKNIMCNRFWWSVNPIGALFDCLVSLNQGPVFGALHLFPVLYLPFESKSNCVSEEYSKIHA